MQYDPGSISLDGEDRLRGVADEAITKLFASRPDEYQMLYGWERSTVGDIRSVIQEELKARASTGRFDPGLVRESDPSSNVARRSPHASHPPEGDRAALWCQVSASAERFRIMPPKIRAWNG